MQKRTGIVKGKVLFQSNKNLVTVLDDCTFDYSQLMSNLFNFIEVESPNQKYIINKNMILYLILEEQQ